MDVEPEPWLQVWRDKWGLLAERKMRLASLVGSEFHKCVDQYLADGKFTVSDGSDGFPTSCTARVTGMMESFIDWAVNVEGVVHYTEMKVVSRAHKYSGTLDAMGTFAGKPMVFDWKTSSRIYPDMQLQLAAYAQAYNEQYVERAKDIVKEGMIVHVSKDKPRFKLTTKTFKLGKRVFGKFLKLREMFDELLRVGNDIQVIPEGSNE